MTSIITSTVEGVKTEGGVSGFFSGLGKGLVGTVTKPVAGALDFASETAQTVRDMASLSNHRWAEPAWAEPEQFWIDLVHAAKPDIKAQAHQTSIKITSNSFL